MREVITLGSLFDGIGGFPLCAALSGVTPIWAAEVDAACVALTKQRFPGMRHYGDVSKINGADLPPVDIITFGSPCQDLSVAGKRAGIKNTSKGDGTRYRQLGNSLAIPCALRVIGYIADYIRKGESKNEKNT